MRTRGFILFLIYFRLPGVVEAVLGKCLGLNSPLNGWM